MEARDGEENERVGVRRRDLPRRDSLNTEQSSDNTVAWRLRIILSSWRELADNFSRFFGSMVFKEMTLALM